MGWDTVNQADADHTASLRALETAQAATGAAESSLGDAQASYDAAKAAEQSAEVTAENAQAYLVEVSAQVGVDYPPDDPPPPASRSRKR